MGCGSVEEHTRKLREVAGSIPVIPTQEGLPLYRGEAVRSPSDYCLVSYCELWMQDMEHYRLTQFGNGNVPA